MSKAIWLEEAFVEPSRNDCNIQQMWNKVSQEHKL
jgi:hypothetical protein